MQQKQDATISPFIIAHDAVRIAKNSNLEPLQFLTHYPADFNPQLPVFKLRGKDYILGLSSQYEHLKFSRESVTTKESKEYEQMVKIWNRNFGENGTFMEFLHFIIKETIQ
jgi:hypothetical protein